MPRPWVRSHHVVVFVFAATGADRARGRCYFGGYRCAMHHGRFFLIVIRNTRLCEQALRCLRQQGTCHFIYGSFFARRAKNKP